MSLKCEVKNILFDETEIAGIVERLAARLEQDYSGKNPLFVCVLNGACVFFCDLIRKIDIPLEIAFIKAASYQGTTSTGNVKISEDLPTVAGRDVVLVEDIVDTANTLSRVKSKISESGPNSVRVCCLLDKPSRRVVSGFKADYTGAEIEDLFVVGYGLDYNWKFRNLPYIGILDNDSIT